MKYQKFDLLFYVLVVALLLVLAVAAARGQTSSGGAYAMTKTVVAGGGGSDLQQSQTKAGNTVGQAIAGRQSSGGNFTLYSGFWTPDAFAPTAATVSVGGRVLTASGAGIRNVVVSITFPSGETRSVTSGSLGYFRFDDVPVGGTYVIQLVAKRHIFPQPVVVRSIMEETHDIDFVAAPQ